MIKPLTSLRFFFAFLVFLSHYTINGKELFYDGFIGVEFFFILSGFIISYNYKEKFIRKSISIKEFVIARIARIYPLHCITFLLVVLLYIRNALRHVITFPWKQLFFNTLLLQSYIPVKAYYFSFNAVSWSISDELFFYAMFPVLIIFFTNVKKQILALLCCIILISYFAAIMIIPEQYHHAIFYISPFCRIIDFIIGIGLFHCWEYIRSDRVRSKLPSFFLSSKVCATSIKVIAVGLLIIMIVLSKNIPQVYKYASYYWIPMSVIIFCFAQPLTGGGISLLLSWKPLVVAGEVSFGFYMLHAQMISIVISILTRISPLLREIEKFLIVFVLIVAASLVSFYWFEKPANRLVKKYVGIVRKII
jgi:peptidoglycan/LPS O-acetylase OafA/YrhL